ncbi:neutral zinc metallopeptidase [Nonomuraea purpurea]|uniref:Neutral zinc metallopeptidase n=1 Tax=Nonomuraea purpurea TaxID=1849276 RepID=A0ABV8G4A1_9ACTN
MGVVGVLGVVFGGMAALFVLVVIGAAMMRGSDRSDTTNPVAIPTYSPSESTTEDDDEPFPTRTRTQTETDEPTPPPVTVNRSLKNNTMYLAGALPRMNCQAGNVNIYNHGQLKALIMKTSRCMDQGWGSILQKKGIQFSKPNWAIAAKKGRGACGDYPSPGSIVPYYCPRNHTIYVSTSATTRGNGSSAGYGQLLSWHGSITSIMAHEYGHHVQKITGLMESYWSSEAESGQSARLALSRRLELQATCFAGMWMRSVATSYPISTTNRGRLYWFYGRVGDQPGYPRDHGTPVNNNRWFRQGWEKSKTHQCNTWMAPSSTVS